MFTRRPALEPLVALFIDTLLEDVMHEALGKNWLEVALNGPWTRKRQPGIPVSVAEIVEQGIACVNAGASIVHVHAYDENTALKGLVSHRNFIRAYE